MENKCHLVIIPSNFIDCLIRFIKQVVNTNCVSIIKCKYHAILVFVSKLFLHVLTIKVLIFNLSRISITVKQNMSILSTSNGGTKIISNSYFVLFIFNIMFVVLVNNLYPIQFKHILVFIEKDIYLTNNTY